MAFPTNEELTRLAEPVVARYGMDIENLGTVRSGKKSRVDIALDSDSRPTLDELEEVSNELSQLFDEAEERGELNFGPGYTLELSTPGVEMPLMKPRHFRRNRGRVIALGEGKERQLWRIGPMDAGEGQVALVRAVKKGEEVRVFPVSELAGTVVEIEFKASPEAEMELAEQSFEQLEAVASPHREDNK